MTDEFILEINYKNQQREFTARLIIQGFTHKFLVLVEDNEVYFELDEEGQYRAIKLQGQNEAELDKIDKNLLAAIGTKIHEILA